MVRIVLLLCCLLFPLTADAQQLVNRSHQLAVGLQDWWRVVPQWAGGTIFRNLMLKNDLVLNGLTAAGSGWSPSTAPGSSGEIRFQGVGTQYLSGTTGMVGAATTFTIIIGYRATTQVLQTLYREEGDANNAVRLYLRDSADNEVYFSMRDTVTGCCLTMSYTGGTPLDGVRHYIGVVQAAKADRKMYLDGVQVASDNLAIGTPVLTGRRLGNSFSGSSPLIGAIEEAFVYNRALSGAEMMQLLQSARQGHPQLLATTIASRATLLLSAPASARAGNFMPWFLR